MSKKNIMVSVDEFIHKKAKERYINISQVCESALRVKVQGEITQTEKERECFNCKAKDVEMTWLCPDEIWMCNKCLTTDIRRVSVCIGTR